jgi:hypothetical protein
MTSTLTGPGQLHRARIAGVDVTAQLTIEGGVTITVWPTTSRHDAVAFSHVDRKLAAHRYQVIAQLAATGSTAQQIADTLGSDRRRALAEVAGILDDALAAACDDDSTASASAIRNLQSAKESLESDVDKARRQAIADRVNRRVEEAYAPTYGGQCDEEDEPLAPVVYLRTVDQIRAARAAKAGNR